MDFKKIQSFTFIGVLVAITIVFLWMLRPYIYPVFWAAVLASLFQPVYKRLERKLKRSGLAASLTLVIVVLVFLIPLSGLVSLIAQQAYSVYKDFGNQTTIATITSAVEGYMQWPVVDRLVGEMNIQEQVSKWGASISRFVYEFATRSGQNTARVIIQFFIMLYTLYYFLRDGRKIMEKLVYLIPLGDTYEKALFNRFVSTARATLKGTLVIGVVQGLIGTIAFLITGVPASVFWGLIMIILSIIPGIGAAIILLPAAVIMFITGNIWQGVVIVIALVASSIIDNVLRGPLVGKDAQMHPLLIFFATLGGLLSFGISGVVIGPIITAFFLSIWEIYGEKYKTDLSRSD